MNVQLHIKGGTPVSEYPAVNLLYTEVLEMYYGDYSSLTADEVNSLVNLYNSLMYTNSEVYVIREKLQILIDLVDYPQTTLN